MAKIVMNQDGVVIKEFIVGEKGLTIGRKSSNDIQIDDITVSGQHASIQVEKNYYMDSIKDAYIEDLGSTNGTLINGKKIKKHMLRHGDVVQIGRHEFKYLDEDAPDFNKTVILRPDDTKTKTDSEKGAPSASMKVLTGPQSGKVLELVKSYTTIGNLGTIVIVTRRTQGYYISQVTNKTAKQAVIPTANANPIGTQSVPLQNGDIITIGSLHLEFRI